MSINLSFTQFMNYAVKNGSPRITIVKTIKRDDGYHPGKDYWKEFRDMIRKIHQSNSDISMLDNLLISIPSKKVSNYRQAITKYKSFIKGKNIEWFDPPKSKYSYGNVTINVNHELGLYINGKPYLVKLLLAKDATKYAKKSNLQTTLALSYLATEFNQLPDETKSMILIVDKKKTYESTYPNNEIQALLKSEILSFETIFNSI